MLAVGSATGGTNQKAHNFAEIFQNDSWTKIDPYPFHDVISYAPVVYYKSKFYVLGGNISADKWIHTKIIARLNTNLKWSQCGELLEPRRVHSVIVSQSEFIVVGGTVQNSPEGVRTEQCSISNTVVCSNLADPNLSDYKRYPELFNVPDSFCKSL